MSAAGGGYYQRLHLRLLAEGLSAREAMAEVAEAYLDGRPEKVNGHKMSRSGQDNLFWTTACVKVADAQDWQGQAMGLALTRYLAQDKIAAPGLLDVLAQQLVRKHAAVLSVMTGDRALQSALGLQELPACGKPHAWIVDTSIEGDHCFFSGCLKLSLEEILITLRDDRRHLSEGQVWTQGQPPARQLAATLYPAGFDAGRFVDVIQRQAVWNDE